MSDFYSAPEHQPFALGEGPVGALLLHGFPGTPAEMRPLGEKLAAAGWAAYGPLLPGFGPQIATLGKKTRHDWLAAAQEKWQQVQARHQTAVLIGLSMGGALALNDPDKGWLGPGAVADAVVLDAPTHLHLPYRPDDAVVWKVIKSGRVI